MLIVTGEPLCARWLRSSDMTTFLLQVNTTYIKLLHVPMVVQSPNNNLIHILSPILTVFLQTFSSVPHKVYHSNDVSILWKMVPLPVQSKCLCTCGICTTSVRGCSHGHAKPISKQFETCSAHSYWKRFSANQFRPNSLRNVSWNQFGYRVKAPQKSRIILQLLRQTGWTLKQNDNS